MARYFIESKHTPEQCLSGLDEVLAQGMDTLARFDFACATGDHTNHICYTQVDADNEQAARAQLPSGIRNVAQITEIGKFTAEQIRSFHN